MTETQETVTVGVRLRQFWCGLRGHNALIKWEPDRMFMKCTSCGHDTPGWSLNEPPPHRTQHARRAIRLAVRKLA